jgi:hypothetical protein
MNKQQELAEQIVGILYKNKTDEADEGSWIESKDFYKAAAAIVEAMGVQQEKEQPSLQSGKLSAEEVLYKHILADADNHVMGTTLVVNVPPLEELKNNQQFQMHVAAMKEYAQQFQQSAPAKEVEAISDSEGKREFIDQNVKNFMAHAYFQGAMDSIQLSSGEKRFEEWYERNKDVFSLLHNEQNDERIATQQTMPQGTEAGIKEAAKEAISVPAQQGVEDIEALVNRLWSKWSLEYEGQTIMSKDLFTLAIQDINAAQSIQPSLEENKP